MSRYFIVIHDFMIKDLKLKGYSLLVYAMMFSFYVNSSGVYTTFTDEMVKSMCGVSRRQYYDVAKNLISRGLVHFGTSNCILVINGDCADIAQVNAEIAHLIKNTNNLSSTSKKNLKEIKKINENNLDTLIKIAKTPWVKK